MIRLNLIGKGMYNKLKTEFNKAAETYNIPTIELFDVFIGVYSEILFEKKVPSEYEKITYILKPLIDTLIDLFTEEPFKDHLGKLREDLGFTNPKLAQFNTPDSLAMALASMMGVKEDKPRKYSDFCCGTGVFTLQAMNQLRPEFKNPAQFKIDNSIYENHYFFLIDKDLISVYAAYIQIMLSHYAYNRNCDPEWELSKPRMELIIGDALFIQKPHIIAYSNTGRDFYEIPTIRHYQLYEEEIASYDYIRLKKLREKQNKLLSFNSES